jgi:hypothetical protein
VQISGEVIVGAECASFEKATAFVYLEDVGNVDAAARRLASVTLSPLTHRSGSESHLPFAISAPDVFGDGPTHEIAVRVHVSLDGEEDVTVRDLVSMEHVRAIPETLIGIQVMTV